MEWVQVNRLRLQLLSQQLKLMVANLLLLMVHQQRQMVVEKQVLVLVKLKSLPMRKLIEFSLN